MKRLARFRLLLGGQCVGVVTALTACGGGLPPEDKANIQNAAKLSAMGYAHQDAGTAGAALDRGAYCASAAVLRDLKLPAVDAGINCGP